MSFTELVNAIGAKHIGSGNNSGFSSVFIDSRNVTKGALFIALKGNSLDGHAFVENAFLLGADAAMVEASAMEKYNLAEIAAKAGKDLIVVEDSLLGLMKAAGTYLAKFPNLVKIAITGSAGKTTTKEIAYSIISCEKNAICSMGNYNSETGYSLSAFNVRACHEAAIFEIAANSKGDIAEGVEVIKPNIAVITCIGHSHIEYFGNIMNILYEKKDIFSLLTPNDTAIIPSSDAYRDLLAQDVTAKKVFYGEDTFTEFESWRGLGLEGTEIIWAGEKIRFALPGRHSLHDALAAIAIARELNVSKAAIRRGLENVRPVFGRLEILQGRTTVINDCYNANPESTGKSLDFCDDLDWSGRKIYVLADMLELGSSSRPEHEKIALRLGNSKADAVFLFGNEMASASALINNKRVFHTVDINVLSTALDNSVQAGDIVLLKGSRGCALERLTNILIKGAANVS
jgi:UDP-N-acetylmuramoyl-tripeptide--D-alanyl-D-alanine ligase